jgi:hypothetical protein
MSGFDRTRTARNGEAMCISTPPKGAVGKLTFGAFKTVVFYF